MMNVFYALDAAVEPPMKEILQGNGLVTLLCILAGALLLTALICIGVAVYKIRKDRKGEDR